MAFQADETEHMGAEQFGKEDGHQGGRRYQPNDPGHLILKKWVNNQVNIQGAYGLPECNKK